MEKPVRIGIIGCGSMGNYHAAHYKAIRGVELVALADIVKAKALDAAKRWGIPAQNVYEDYREMLDEAELDGVSVCTMHKQHWEPSVEALKRGVNVLVEKPMAATAEEALEMLKASRKSGRILMVGFQNRYEPEIIAAKRFVEKGVLGRFYYGEVTLGGRRRGIGGPSFISKATAGGGVLLDLGCYDVDNAFNILGFPKPVAVSAITSSAVGRNPEAVIEEVCVWDVGKYEVEDFVAAFIRFEDDSVLLLKESWAMHANTLGSSFFLGDKGGLRLKPLEVYRDEAGYMVNITPQLPKTEWFDADSLKVFEEAIGRPRSQWDDLNRAKIISFVEAIRHGKPSPITPAEIVLEQCVLESIYKSASLKREVTFKLPKELLEGD